MATTTNTEPTLSVWTWKYKKNWNSIISPESFSHPAKFARGLLETIVDHALEEGWVKPGDHCIDPFGGIASGAYVCITKGLRWTGVELEEHFHNLGQGCDCTGLTTADYVRFYARWPRMRYAEGRYWCPRCLAQVTQVTGERRPTQVTFRIAPRSGLYDEWAMFPHGEKHPCGLVQPRPAPKVPQKTFAHLTLPLPDRRDGWRPPRTQALFAAETASYGRNSGVIPHTQAHHYQGNIEAWAAKGYTGATLLRGDSRELAKIIQAHADLLVSSSPYNNKTVHESGHTMNWSGPSQVRRQDGHTPLNIGQSLKDAYGTTAGQLGNLPSGSLDAALAPGTEPTPQLDLLVSSSPYTGSQQVDNRQHAASAMSSTWRKRLGSITDGTDPAQLANLPEGSVDATIASPPYADGCTHTGGADPQPQHVQGGPLRYVQYGADCTVASPPHGPEALGHHRGAEADAKEWRTKSIHGTTYGASTQNLGNMPAGDVAAVVQGDLVAASPPHGDTTVVDGRAVTDAKTHTRPIGKMSDLQHGYGAANGQLGNTSADTFWSAARTIIEQTFQILKPGAHAVWVTKMYIRSSQLVDFPGDWRKLCEAVGFQTVHIHLAMLVERRVETHLFEGETTYEQWTESFFRRIARRKSGVGIEHETIICQVKPLTAAPMPPDEAWQQLPLVEVAECSVSSPSYGGNEKSDYLLSADGKTRQRDEKRGYAQGHGCFRGSETYGQTDGQLGAMKVGRLDCAITSSPYAGKGEVLGTYNGIDWTKTTGTGKRLTPGRRMQPYSTNVNNLGNMPEGQLDCAISSPPYVSTPIAACEGNMGGGPGGRKASALTTVSGNIKVVGYSANPANLANLPEGGKP